MSKAPKTELEQIVKILADLAEHNCKLTQQVVELRREFREYKERQVYNNVVNTIGKA